MHRAGGTGEAAGQAGGAGRAVESCGLIQNNSLQDRMGRVVLNVFPEIFSYERITLNRKQQS